MWLKHSLDQEKKSGGEGGVEDHKALTEVEGGRVCERDEVREEKITSSQF